MLSGGDIILLAVLGIALCQHTQHQCKGRATTITPITVFLTLYHHFYLSAYSENEAVLNV